MQLKSLTAAAILMGTLLFAACLDKQATTVVESPETVTVVEAPVPAPSVIETPVVTTTPEVRIPAPVTATVEQIPSVLRRTAPASEPSAAPPQAQVTNTFPPRISVLELKEMADQGTAVIVDVRDRVSYAMEHIPGSINLPLQEAVARASELPKGKTIVTYCA